MPTPTPVLSLALQIAAVEAADTRYEFIEPEHLFVGLCKLEGFANTNRLRALGVPETQVEILAAEIDLLMGLLGRFDIKPSTFRYALRQHKGTGSFTPPASEEDWMMHRSLESREIFKTAEKVARQSNSSMVAAFHLLAALLSDARSRLALWLQSKKVDVSGLRQAAESTLLPGAAPAKTRSDDPSPLVRAESVFTRYSRDLTQFVRRQALHFSPEYQAAAMDIVKILNRRVKRNPLLLEEDMPTADKIVQSAAWLLLDDKAPTALRHIRIIQMDVTDMAQDIVYQGEFTERIRDFIKEASQEDDLTLFINGIHAIIGSGSILADMSEVISVLKLALRQKKLRCIGATSPQEFKRYIGEDADWRSLFAPLEVSNSALDAVTGAEVIESPRISKPLQRPAKLSAGVTPPLRLATKPLKEASALPTRTLQITLDARLDTLQAQLTRFGVQLRFSAAAMAILRRLEENSNIFETEFATRVENPLGGMLLRGEIDYGQNVLVDVFGGELVFQTRMERRTP